MTEYNNNPKGVTTEHLQKLATNMRHMLIIDNKVELSEFEGLSKLINSADRESVELAISMMEIRK